MPKISSLNVKSVIIKFIVKSLALTTMSIILISSVASFIILNLTWTYRIVNMPVI